MASRSGKLCVKLARRVGRLVEAVFAEKQDWSDVGRILSLLVEVVTCVLKNKCCWKSLPAEERV